MKKKLLLNLLCLTLPALAIAQVNIPKDYVALTESPANGKKTKMIYMLFDDDLKSDAAVLIKHKTDFSKYKLLIYLSSFQKRIEIDLISKNDFPIYPTELITKNNVLQFGYFEDGTAAFGRFLTLRYEPNNKKIKVIGYDVTYRASPTEHIDKSYNLITGKYIVKRTYYNANGTTKVEEFTGGNDHFRNKVFTNDLNITTLINLDDVGSKYE